MSWLSGHNHHHCRHGNCGIFFVVDHKNQHEILCHIATPFRHTSSFLSAFDNSWNSSGSTFKISKALGLSILAFSILRNSSSSSSFAKKNQKFCTQIFRDYFPNITHPFSFGSQIGTSQSFWFLFGYSCSCVVSRKETGGSTVAVSLLYTSPNQTLDRRR